MLLTYLFFPLQVLFRLNFLVLVLCVVMDRPYQFYYFVPLVTFWFFVIYGTLAMWPQILQKKANGRCRRRPLLRAGAELRQECLTLGSCSHQVAACGTWGCW